MTERMPINDGYEGDSSVLQVECRRISDGLGYGDGGISTEELRKQIGDENYRQAEEAMDNALVSPDVVVPVEANDDGCGDGRGVLNVFVRNPETGHDQELGRSLHRAKVFGAGPAMSTATLIGLGKTQGQPLMAAFHQGIDKLKEKRIEFGGHTDEHGNAQNCGCGAIDKAPEALAHTVQFEDEIRGTIKSLGVDTTGLEDVQDKFRTYASELATVDDPYSGREVMDEIVESGAIVKKLEGKHVEIRIVLNMVEDYTVDQKMLRAATGGQADVFAVDVWRMQRLAEQMYDDPAERQKAFLSELVYTLGVAATLTKGDLPVYVVEGAQVATPAFL